LDIQIEKIRAYFSRDRYAAAAGITIDGVREDAVRCSMDITDAHRNAGGAVQGGAIFTLADFAFGVHANLAMLCGSDIGITLGQSCSISFLKSTKGSRLIAETACLSKGAHISVYRVSIRDNLGNLVAEMHGNGFTTKKTICATISA
jgi:acyl-CoA thioesterase